MTAPVASSPRTAARRRERRRLLIVAAVLGTCAFGLFRVDGGSRGLAADTAYLTLGFNLARFGEYHNSKSLPEDRAAGRLTPYFQREPGFPLYLAAVFASSPETDSLTARCFQDTACTAAAPVMRRVWRVTSVLVSASVAFMFIVTFLLTRSRSASVAAGLAGLLVMPMLAAASVHDFVAALLLLLHATLAALTFRRPRLATGVAGGLALGLLALTRAVFQYWLAGVVVVLAAGLWQDRRRRRVLMPACAALAAAAWMTAAPWMLRNAVVAGHFGVSGLGGWALALRAEHDLMTWAEVRGAFAYWLPDVSVLGAARGRLMSRLEPPDFGYTRFDEDRRRGFIGRTHRHEGEVAARAERIDPRWRESAAAQDAALRRAALGVMRDNWLKHAVLTPALALHGANVFPDRCQADVRDVAARFGAPLGWPMRRVCGVAGLAAFLGALAFLGVLATVAWRRRDVGLALLLSPAVYAFGIYAFALYFVGRYSRPLVPLLVVAAAMGAHEARLRWCRRPAAGRWR